MAASEFKDAVRSAADAVAKYIADVGTMEVKTSTLEAGTADPPQLAASTIIRFDGDNESVIPGKHNAAGKWEIDTALYELHMQNVRAAIDYRSKMLESMLKLLRPPGSGP